VRGHAHDDVRSALRLDDRGGVRGNQRRRDDGHSNGRDVHVRA
jgi:hypothetical protein